MIKSIEIPSFLKKGPKYENSKKKKKKKNFYFRVFKWPEIRC